MRTTTKLLTSLIAFGAMGAANAIPISVAFTGSVDLASDGNDFGLSVGDSITGGASVDATMVGFELFTAAEGLDAWFNVGSALFSTEDLLLVVDGPTLLLLDGGVFAFGFVSFDALNNLFDASSNYPIWSAFDSVERFAQGSLTATVSTVSVPEPATLALLAAGLVGLLVPRKRKLSAI